MSDTSSLSLREQAIHLEDILDDVFAYLRTKDLARCARVCRSWERPSTKLVWRDLHGLVPLLSILGTLNSQSDNATRTFVEHSAKLQNWDRFYRYASLVKKADIFISTGAWNDEQNISAIHPRTIQQLAVLADAMQLPILPNISELRLIPSDTHSCEVSIFLISNNLSSLSLQWREVTWSPLLPVLKRVCRCERLSNLIINVDYELGTGGPLLAATAEAIDSLAKLQSVELSTSMLLQPSVWRVLRSKHTLKRIWGLDYHEAWSRMPLGSIDHLEIGGGLDSLEHVTLRLSYGEALHLLRNSLSPSARSIMLRLFEIPSSDSVSILSRSLASNTPNLEKLVMMNDGPVALGIDWIAPLLQFTNLTCLEVVSDGIPTLSNEDYCAIARGLPLLDTLILSPDPMTSEPANATLVALSHIAEYCRQMRKLGLYIDTSVERLPNHETTLSAFSSSLRGVTFGLSPVSDTPQLAESLIRLFLWCKPYLLSFEAGMKRSGRSQAAMARIRYDRIKSNWERVWEEVKRLRPFADAIKQASESRCARLEAENRSLRDQITRIGL